MAKFGHTKTIKVGKSEYLLIPFKVKTDKRYPFKSSEENLVMEIKGKRLEVKTYGK